MQKSIYQKIELNILEQTDWHKNLQITVYWQNAGLNT